MTVPSQTNVPFSPPRIVRGQFSHTERIAERVLSLQLSPALSDAHVDAAIRAVRGAFRA